MASDTITLSPQTTPEAWSEPPATEQPASPVNSALAASETAITAPAVSHNDSAAPPNPEVPPDLDLLGDRIAELSARIQAATYELLCYLREFDRHHGWEGFRSCADRLNLRTGLDLGAAREKLRVAAALADLNHISAAMACGRFSYLHCTCPYSGGHARYRSEPGRRRLRRHRRAGGAAGAGVAAG